MEQTQTKLSARAASLLCILIFFFNTFLMPQGLSLTLLLTPVWLYLLARDGRTRGLKLLILFLGFYACIHLFNGADVFYYALSDLMLFVNAVFCMAVWPWLNRSDISFDRLFRQIVVLNFIFCCICILLLWVPQLKPVVWYEMSMSEGIRVIPRLKLFTYEASHYSYLLAPLVIWFLAKALWGSFRKELTMLLMLAVPLGLSLSFGVLACLGLSAVFMLLFYFRQIVNSPFRRTLFVLIPVVLAGIVLLLWYFYPDNLLFVRVQNMWQGKDTSARGRTYESFILADKIVSTKSWLWGIGPGQLKLEGRNIIIQYYFYSAIPEVIRIPNACAETIICFGYVGFALRILTQLFFAVRCHIQRNPFQLWLFLFLFIFQFTGSFITNWVEYFFWLLCFVPMWKIEEREWSTM